ncbi:MAG: hypothetical protein WB424_16505 [Terracidiphilus sp.]
MSFEDRKNRVQQTFVPNASAFTLPIAPNLMILAAKVILTGTITIAGGTTNGSVLGEGGPINLLKRIRVIGNPAAGSPYPGGWLVDASARSLLRWAQFQHYGVFIGEQSGSTLGNGAPGTYPIYLEVPIYFADTNLRNFAATALYADPAAYASLQLQIQTGGPTDCFAGTDRTWTFNLQVQYADDRADILPGPNTYALYQEDHDLMIPSANTRLSDTGLPEDGAFLTWQILAEQSSSFFLSDALLNRLTVQGPTYNFDEFYQDIRAKMYDDEWLAASANAAGLFFIDMTNGLIRNSNLANSLSVQYNVNNPSGSYQDKLKIFTRRVYPVQIPTS